MSFKKNKYLVIKKAISPDLADFCYTYFLNKRRVAKFLFDEKYLHPYETMFGIWSDDQVPNTYSHYADLVMETLLLGLIPRMEKETGFKVYPTYSYARIYKNGDVLHRHSDRYSCEVSTTLNLGGDPWPIYLEPSGKKGMAGIKINLNPGDMLIYRGCELEHWREVFNGNHCGQVFLHYNDQKSKDAEKNKFDGRPFIGLPGDFAKSKTIK
tara:strand:+ start:4883 stop:5515 length:633 start_codon:yes stop_codon:yes gene_type:complete